MADYYYKPFDARLQFPFYMCVSGPSQAGKTTFVGNLINEWSSLVSDGFDYSVWFYGESLPRFQSSSNMRFVKGFPLDFDDYIIPNKNGLFIIDDLMKESANNADMTRLISNKVHHQSLCVISIVQDMYCAGRERITCMKNCTYLILFSNPLNKTIARLVGQRFMPGRSNLFIKIFENAVRQPYQYLLVDGAQRTPNQARLRTNIFGQTQTIYHA